MTYSLKNISVMFAAAAMFLPFLAMANEVEVNSSYVGINPNNVVEVVGDAAPGFPAGSIASDGSGKTQFTFTPEQLFGRDVTLGEIESMSYWTKKDTDHVTEPGDWYLQIYTKPYDGDTSPASWYGERITAEPYFSENLVDPVDTWNEWSTDGASNKLRFFDSAENYYGGYADPTWDTYVAGPALSGFPLATREILYVTIQTGSGWADGFEGQVDGLTIELDDDTSGTVNFEAEVPDTTAPLVTIDSPLDGEAVSGMVTVVGTIEEDEAMGNHNVSLYEAGVDFNNFSLRLAQNNVPNSSIFTAEEIWTFDSTAFADGEYLLRFAARDAAGNRDLSSPYVGGDSSVHVITIVIDNDPDDMDVCKKDGWEAYGFENQGQCVRFVETGKDSR